MRAAWAIAAAALLPAALATAPAAQAQAPGTAAAGVDYNRSEPPAARSWQATDDAARGPLDDAAAAAASPEAAVEREEGVLVRALVRMVLVLFGLVLGMLVLARLARAMQSRLPGWVGGGGGPRGTAPRLKIVDRLALGPKHTLAWVESEAGAAFLVAFGEGGTSLLGPVAAGSRPSFAAAMAEVTDDDKRNQAPAVPTANDSAAPAS